eukprot:1085612-Amphidinium_carterae.1
MEECAHQLLFQWQKQKMLAYVTVTPREELILQQMQFIYGLRHWRPSVVNLGNEWSHQIQCSDNERY